MGAAGSARLVVLAALASLAVEGREASGRMTFTADGEAVGCAVMVDVDIGDEAEAGAGVKTGVLVERTMTMAWAVTVPTRSGGCSGLWLTGTLQAKTAISSTPTTIDERLAFMTACSSATILRRKEGRG